MFGYVQMRRQQAGDMHRLFARALLDLMPAGGTIGDQHGIARVPCRRQ
jgi:hypothetical protein